MGSIIPVVLVLVCSTAFGFGGNFLNLYTRADNASKGDFEFTMNHRFFGKALEDDPLDSFFGLDDGANVRVGLSYFLYDDLDIGVTHTRMGHRNTVSVGWNTVISTLNAELGALAGYTSFKPSPIEDREGGIVATLTASTWFLNNRVRPVLNYAFDGYSEDNGPGIGLEIAATEKFSVIGELFPSADEELNASFSVGGRYSTWGHQFLLGLSNSNSIGVQRQLAGAASNDLSVTLSIRRVF